MSWWFAISFGLFVVTAGVQALYRSLWSPHARARRRLAAGRTTAVEDGAVITLTGSVRALRSLLEAPLSGQLCVAFYSASTVTGGSNDLHPDKIVMRQMTPFDLVTAEGVVRIDGTSADLAHPTRPNVPRDLARETAFLVAHGFNAELVSTSHFQEAVVIEGDTVRVQGLAVVERAPPNDAQGYRENERSIRLVAYGAHPLTIGPASPA